MKNRNEKLYISRQSPFHFLFPGTTWIRVYEFNDLLQVLKTFNGSQISTLVAGNTAKGQFIVIRA